MCVVSMVMDHYRPQFEPYTAPQTFTGGAIHIGPSVDMTELRKLVEDFKEAVAAAKKLDALTSQPDCEDPEKAKLQERVAELEKTLAAVREAAGKWSSNTP